MVKLLVVLWVVKLNKKDIKTSTEGESEQLSPSSFYVENGKYVFTEVFHLKRGYCCGNGCRHCPYDPKHKKGTINLKDKKTK